MGFFALMTWFQPHFRHQKQFQKVDTRVGHKENAKDPRHEANETSDKQRREDQQAVHHVQ